MRSYLKVALTGIEGLDNDVMSGSSEPAVGPPGRP